MEEENISLYDYLKKLYDEDETLSEDLTLQCIYGIIIILEKIKEKNLSLEIESQDIYISKQGLPSLISQTMTKIKDKKIINQSNLKNFVIICWQILTLDLSNEPINQKKNKLRRNGIDKSYSEILDELDKLISGNDLNPLKKLIEYKFNKTEKLNKVIISLGDNEEEEEEEDEKDSDQDSRDDNSDDEDDNDEDNDNNNIDEVNQDILIQDDNKNEELINNIENNFKTIISGAESENEEDLSFFDKHKDFFEERNFILTEESKRRLLLLKDFINLKIPVLLEGPTGTSKTLSAELICDLLLKEKYGKIDEKKSAIKFNLSSETRIHDLLGKYIGSKTSFGGMKMKDGPFIEAYKKGRVLILDEINLASITVLQCIQESLDNNFSSIDIPGRPLKKINKKKGFSLIATQNPNTGLYAHKRQNIRKELLSRISNCVFSSFH